ncbi:uncharacterized protein LOC143839468 [Paroedura picta]|uniref:uncharacterized protein LOC143839468 n=1 Tax=Paroedura picta TaxID=143630 RepID=UPI0040563EEA
MGTVSISEDSKLRGRQDSQGQSGEGGGREEDVEDGGSKGITRSITEEGWDAMESDGSVTQAGPRTQAAGRGDAERRRLILRRGEAPKGMRPAGLLEKQGHEKDPEDEG